MSAAKILGKTACFFSICWIVIFSVRFHWSAIQVEGGTGFIVFSKPSFLGFFFLAASLLCGLAWLVVTLRLKSHRTSH